jgi:hypothetical protein
VLRLVAQGLANKEIASRIGISESTVKNTRQQLFAKADVRTRSQLVCLALEQNGDLLYQRGSQVQLGAGPGTGSQPPAGWAYRLLFGDTGLVFTSAEKLWKRRHVATALQWNWGGPQAQRRPET